MRKADKEGHSANAVDYALFRIFLALRFRRCGKTQVDSTRSLLEVLTDGRGKGATKSCIVTAERGYGKFSFMEVLSEFGFRFVFVIPEKLLRVHPLVESHTQIPAGVMTRRRETQNKSMMMSQRGTASVT